MFEQDLQPLGDSRLIVYGEYAFLTFQAHETQFVAKMRTMSIHGALMSS
jgi:hypothetical protein